MKIKLHMLGELRQFLPPSAQYDQADVEIAEGSSLRQLIETRALPADTDYLVIINEQLVNDKNFDELVLGENDEVTLFPPIKGG